VDLRQRARAPPPPPLDVPQRRIAASATPSRRASSSPTLLLLPLLGAATGGAWSRWWRISPCAPSHSSSPPLSPSLPPSLSARRPLLVPRARDLVTCLWLELPAHDAG
jgi:hypothetical protein